MSEPIGVMVCGHGSRDPHAVAEFSALAEQLRERFPRWPLEHGFLEFARPVIREGLDRLVAKGARRILAVPGLLFAAGHAKNDIPSVLNTYQAGRPGLKIEYGRDLGLDAKMLQAAAGRIRQAVDAAGGAVALHETLLVVVGRGASDPDANADVAKVTRMLWEGFGFGWAETAYSGVTFPLVEPALEKAARLGFRRIVVFPYFLFTGILVQRIYDGVRAVARRHPELEFLEAPYLNDHPLVLDTFVERAHDILAGDTRMNCQLCKYRTQVLGFEAEVGLPQQSHHHHVEGIGLRLPPPLNSGVPEFSTHSSRSGEHPTSVRGRAGEGGQRPASFPLPYPSPQGGGNERVPGSQAHDHDHHHGHGHHPHSHDSPHDHHHPYPHADHPLGPRSLKRG